MTEIEDRVRAALREFSTRDTSEVPPTMPAGLDRGGGVGRRVVVVAGLAAGLVGLAELIERSQGSARPQLRAGASLNNTFAPTSTATPRASGPPIEVLPQAPIGGRFGAAVVWTGQEMIIWGGLGTPTPNTRSGSPWSDGAAFDPAAKSWRLISAAPITGRGGSAVAWTGTEMIICGGANTEGVLLDGAAYDPARNTWRTIETGPLRPWTSIVAVWTGDEMIVLGGDSLTTQALAYTPKTDSWRHLAAPSAPLVVATAAPALPLAWNGRNLLAVLQPSSGQPTVPVSVLGSDSPQIVVAENAFVRQIGVYTMSNDTWADSFIPVGAPEPALVHLTTLKTTDGSNSTVAIFPSSQSTPTVLDINGACIGTSASRPSNLTQVTATPVWTGDEILYWGGGETGLEWNPSSGVWRNFAAGSLRRRTASHNIWAGGELLAWGGISLDGVSESCDDGIRYRPIV